MIASLRLLQAGWRACPRIAIAIAFSVIALAAGANAEPAGTSIRYLNPKYGFSLSLPLDQFDPTKARGQDEGSLWTSRDGKGRLLAVAAPNEAGSSLSAYRQFVMKESYAGARFDYTPVRDNWFVLSGEKDGRIFYERITFACDGRYIYGWQLTYPIEQRLRYDAMVEEIHRSYRAGRGEDGRCGRGAAR